jgi:hypothetical protein
MREQFLGLMIGCAFLSGMLGSEAFAGLPSNNCVADSVQAMGPVDTSA